MDINNYTDVLLQLLPTGSAWHRDDDSAIALLMRGLAEEFARIDTRGNQLIKESLPSGVSELLEQWEADYGLNSSTEFDQRLTDLKAAYSVYGSQSRAFYLSIATAYGVTATIKEYQEAVFGEDFGGYFWGTDWMFVVELVMPTDDVPTEILNKIEQTVRRYFHAHKLLIVYRIPPVTIYNGDIPMQSELMFLVGTAQITGNPGNAYINVLGDIIGHQDTPTNSDLVLI
jgi:uncharacterized protein YmfQ (DUF2313 family)